MFSRPSSPFLTDLYQLTMAFGYWKTGRAQQRSLFHYFFRKNPFQGGFTLTAGLADVLELITQFHFDTAELDYLSSLKGAKDLPLFEDGFLRHLETLRFSGDLWAMPEGTVCFPFEPMVRVEAPLLQAQLLETPLLNLMNFQSLIATKACRVCLAAQGDPVFEFGLRRAQGPDGGVSASRAAFIGGCAGTSNVAAGFRFGIPVKGTHAHSWVMAFPDEPTAFSAYAEALPQNAVFLVDTYNTLEGVQHACEVGRELRQKGFSLSGIRLDSGDLTWLSQESRKILDAQGFPETRILASNDLDEHLIQSLKLEGAKIDIWGVGTKLVTAYDQPALGGVYKLAGLQQPDGEWQFPIKLSEQAIKISTPGKQQVRRYFEHGEAAGDAIFDEFRPIPAESSMIDPLDPTRSRTFSAQSPFEDLLVPVVKAGSLCYTPPNLAEIQKRVTSQLALFHNGIKRFANPHTYPVGLESQLHHFKTQQILALRRHE